MNWFKSGSPWIWMSAGAVSISLISVLGLLAMIAWRGLSFFWPTEVYEIRFERNGVEQTVIGEIYDTETIPKARIIDAGVEITQYHASDFIDRYLIKIGNRERVDLDFMWVLETEIKNKQLKSNIAVVERTKNGHFYGYVEQLNKADKVVASDQLQTLIERSNHILTQVNKLQTGEIAAINHQLDRIRLTQKSLELNHKLTDDALVSLTAKSDRLNQQYQVLEQQLFKLRAEAQRDTLVMLDVNNQPIDIPLAHILDIYFPNDMTFGEKISRFFRQMGKFVSEDPREANTEGGVFPAIFGTVFMVILMSIIVMPFGVIAAIYLHEYAGKNTFTKMIRIAVINLAGVPSVVYGVFGLGFFIYMLGGSLDALFYSDALPNPTFGSPGILWAALTLAILTLPVVIVSTEEGMSRIPKALREGSLALGATRAETLRRVILPMASPAMMTGLILAVARAAGEVAPLMLVGVVKVAPSLPIDGHFPFIHLDRQFMHLGFHIYDVGFQSPNVEAARPMVYATAFLLVTVIVLLNLTAIRIRNHLREKYKSLEH